MRIVIQRVSHASVTIDGVCKSAIQAGFLILVGIEEADTQEDADWLCKKVIGLRVFDDEQGVMNRSILDVRPRKGTARHTSGQPATKQPSRFMNTSATN